DSVSLVDLYCPGGD
ncbi:hypothetical protein A2U01_0081254, partial [Trifolium medium]|nr:hypothetical protein [Trifolium medium]